LLFLGISFNPHNTQPIQQPATARQCDARIAAIFAGPRAVAATVEELQAVNVGPGDYRYRYDQLAGQSVFQFLSCTLAALTAEKSVANISETLAVEIFLTNAIWSGF